MIDADLVLHLFSLLDTSRNDYQAPTATEYFYKKAELIMTPSVKEENVDTTHSEEEETNLTVVPSEFTCPLTLSIMRDPVISKYGQSYERESILRWLSTHSDCPMTRQPLSLKNLITNYSLQARIRRWQIENNQEEEEDDIDAQHDDAEAKNDVNRIFGYITVDPEDHAERSRDDPEIILEVDVNRIRREVRRSERRSKGGGRFLGRLMRRSASTTAA